MEGLKFLDEESDEERLGVVKAAAEGIKYVEGSGKGMGVGDGEL